MIAGGGEDSRQKLDFAMYEEVKKYTDPNVFAPQKATTFSIFQKMTNMMVSYGVKAWEFQSQKLDKSSPHFGDPPRWA